MWSHWIARARIEFYVNDILLASFCATRRDASQNISMHEHSNPNKLQRCINHCSIELMQFRCDDITSQVITVWHRCNETYSVIMIHAIQNVLEASKWWPLSSACRSLCLYLPIWSPVFSSSSWIHGNLRGRGIVTQPTVQCNVYTSYAISKVNCLTSSLWMQMQLTADSERIEVRQTGCLTQAAWANKFKWHLTEWLIVFLNKTVRRNQINVLCTYLHWPCTNSADVHTYVAYAVEIMIIIIIISYDQLIIDSLVAHYYPLFDVRCLLFVVFSQFHSISCCFLGWRILNGYANWSFVIK